jgi:hypothetical protein
MAKFFTWPVETSEYGVDYIFFLNFFNKNILTGTTLLPGGFNSGVPSKRIMEALGSTRNTEQFRLLEKTLNGIKARVFYFLSCPLLFPFPASTLPVRLANKGIRHSFRVSSDLNEHQSGQPPLKARRRAWLLPL